MSTLQNQGNTPVSRREILQATSAGFGYMAFAAVQAQAASTYGNPLTPKKPPMTAKAKRVIFACMRGGPSHVDTIDYKPALAKNDGKTVAKFKDENSEVSVEVLQTGRKRAPYLRITPESFQARGSSLSAQRHVC